MAKKIKFALNDLYEKFLSWYGLAILAIRRIDLAFVTLKMTVATLPNIINSFKWDVRCLLQTDELELWN